MAQKNLSNEDGGGGGCCSGGVNADVTHTHAVSSYGTPCSAPPGHLRDPVVDGVDLSENLNLQVRICAGKLMMMRTLNKTTLADFCTTSCVAQMADRV